jgi:hypothetical protein
VTSTVNKSKTSRNRAAKTTALQKYDQPIDTVDKAVDYLNAHINAHINSENLSPQQLERLREAIKFVPNLPSQIGNLAYQVRGGIIDTVSKNAVVRESISEKVAQLRTELGYKEASKLEMLLIEQVVICWLRMYQVESNYTGAMNGSLTLAHGTYWERRLTSVQGRYLRAMETLARVRRLTRPVPVQVNIGAQQINTVKP